jgi:predicted nucleic acid-binding protein
MRTAIDTNVISALWSREHLASSIARLLDEARSLGALMIVPVVYAELLAYPKATESFLNGFLAETGITVEFRLDDSVWIDAGRRFARHASQRRKAGQGEPKRLLADFVIGSHAVLQADRLMSLDTSRYRQYYPELKLV